MGRIALYIITGVFTLLLIYLSFSFKTFIEDRNELVQTKGLETTASLKNDVNEILSTIAAEGKRLADLFGSKNFSEEEIKTIIRESALSIREIQGVTACFEPFAFSSQQRLFCPYYNKGSQSYVAVEESYDYSISGDPSSLWYTSVRDEGAKWVEPYYAKAAQDWYVDYGIPFHYNSGPNKGAVKGTITMSFICSGFKNLIHSLSVGKTGYGMIISNEGTFLAHPINEYVGTVQLDSIKQTEENSALVKAYDAMLAGQSGSVSFEDELQKDKALFFYDTIPASGWSIGLLFYKQDMLSDAESLNRRYIQLALVFSFMFLGFLAIYFNKDFLDEQEIWQLSIVGAFLLLANIVLICYLQHTTKVVKAQEFSQPIVDLTSLSNFVNQQHIRSENLKKPKGTPIPTGIYIHKLEFEDSYNVNIGGTIWQKYPLDLIDQVSIGFQLPQMSPFAEASSIEEAYRKEIEAKEGVDNYLLVGWDVRVTLRLNLKYADFPLDKRHISVQILPLDNNDRLIFTPDLGSYNYTNPSRKSGLNPDIQISGSEVLQSYFTFSLESYDTDFGYAQKSLFEEVPTLHYNIDVRRLLLNEFVSYLIPIFVTLIMVFILTYACHKTQERQGIIESMAAFFFVLIFSHIDLRKEIVTADIIYIEYFYFACYLMLILATANLIIYTKDKSKIFDFNDNQLFKALYFPTFFFLILLVTLIKFY